MPARLRTLATAAAVGCLLLASGAVPARASNDALFSRQWGLSVTGAPQGWSVNSGGGVIVGVIDTGVAKNHEDLADRIIATSDCLGGICKDGGQDDHGHGTHVAGIIAADRDNGKGISGVAPAAKLVIAKGLDHDGSGNTNDIAAAIDWVVSRGAQIVNLSFGPDAFKKLVFGSPTKMLEAINHAWDLGAIPVLAAGNTDGDPLGLSENYGALNAIVVGATNRADTVASYSRPLGNAKWGIVAPGGSGGSASDGESFTTNNIISTFWTPANGTTAYAASAGTSMAAPHVSGALAMLLAKGYSRDGAVQQLLDSANRGVNCGSGCHGRLDIAKAMGAAGPAPSAPGTTAAPASPGRSSTTRAPRRAGAAPTTTPTAPATSQPPTTLDLSPYLSPVEDERPQVAAGRPRVLPKDSDDPNRAPFIAGATVLLGVAGTAFGVIRRRRLLRPV